MRSFSKLIVGFAITTFFLAGCALEIPEIKIPAGAVKVTMDPAELQKQLDQLAGNQLICTAGLPASAGGVVSSGVASPVNVSAKGGVAPYQILNSAVTFSSDTVISRTYTNNTLSNIVLVDTVSVVDGVGIVTQCNFIVTVKPATSPSTLACTLTPNPSTAAIDAPISMLAAASGGTGIYTFSNLTLASGGSVISALSPINSTQASASVKFSTSGMKTNSVKVTDTNGTFVVCSSSVTINSSASVTLIATPSASVAVGSSIVVSAVASNFSPAPSSYNFSTSEPGITLIPNGSTVSVSVNNGVAHPSFSILATVSNGSQSASSSISLSFTSASNPLICNLSHPAGSYVVGNSVPFTVTATNGEALLITTFVVSSDATVSNTGNATRSVSYANPGTKYVYAIAKSASSNSYCNEGNYLVDSLEVANSGGGTIPLTCTAYTNYNPTTINQYFYAWAVLAGGNPNNRWVESVRVLRNGSAVSNYTGYWYDRYTAVLSILNTTAFNPRTTYQVELTAKDSLGNSTTCWANHTVY